MQVQTIHYTERFERQFRELPIQIQKKALKQEKFFRQNPLHPSLRLHKLKGRLEDCWSISLNKGYRIIFQVMGNGDILFISVGLHAIYDDF